MLKFVQNRSDPFPSPVLHGITYVILVFCLNSVLSVCPLLI